MASYNNKTIVLIFDNNNIREFEQKFNDCNEKEQKRTEMKNGYQTIFHERFNCVHDFDTACTTLAQHWHSIGTQPVQQENRLSMARHSIDPMCVLHNLIAATIPVPDQCLTLEKVHILRAQLVLTFGSRTLGT